MSETYFLILESISISIMTYNYMISLFSFFKYYDKFDMQETAHIKK